MRIWAFGYFDFYRCSNLSKHRIQSARFQAANYIYHCVQTASRSIERDMFSRTLGEECCLYVFYLQGTRKIKSKDNVPWMLIQQAKRLDPQPSKKLCIVWLRKYTQYIEHSSIDAIRRNCVIRLELKTRSLNTHTCWDSAESSFVSIILTIRRIIMSFTISKLYAVCLIKCGPLSKSTYGE